MVKLKTIYTGIILLLLATACQPTAQGELPTRVSFPTETTTLTPTDTPDVTNTPTITVTSSPTATFTLTPTNTPTVTQTPTATWTRPPTSTPTSTQTFTPTASNTPIASITPIPTRTPDVPEIENFQANTVNTDNSSPITLRWSVKADSARLEVLDSAGLLLQQLDVDLIGTLSTTTPATGNVVTYRLTAIRGTQEVRSIVTVDMVASCQISWYFSNPPSSAGCATSLPQTASIFYQQFERGFMFRTTANGQDRVCGYQNDRSSYSCFAPGTFTGTPPSTPPTGLLPPATQFEQNFYNNLATGGLWYDIIGWGLSAGGVVNAQSQIGSDGRIYYQFVDGIYGFDSNLTSTGASSTRITP